MNDPTEPPDARTNAQKWADARDANRWRATRILMIDDDERILGFCARALGQEGYEVTTVSDAGKGLAAALARHHDLVVLDLMMPRLPGLAVLDRLIQRQPWVIVLVVSCLQAGRTRTWCLQLGAADYLSKPFTLAELLARVERLTGGPAQPRSRRARECNRSPRRPSPSPSVPVH